MNSKSVDKQNYNSIDLAKFICSILVVTIHILPFGYHGKTGIISYLNLNYIVQQYLARIAVPFFFVCSGFFLYKKTSLTNFTFESTKKYALRLLRLYITWTLIYFPLSLNRFLKNENGIIYGTLVYIRDFVFTAIYTNLWYLKATAFAVLLISFLLYKKVTPKKIIATAFVFYMIGLFAQSWFGFITPLRKLTPFIWSLLKIVEELIVTTRNGLFFGFIFVGIGMIFAFYKVNISKNKALIGFIVSMFLMLIEVFLLKYFGFIREFNMYLFLVPASFFGFSFVHQIRLKNSTIYKTLRILSSLIFYTHLWVSYITSKILAIICKPLVNTCLLFIVTLILTIAVSMIILKLSELQKFKWFKKLYT